MVTILPLGEAREKDPGFNQKWTKGMDDRILENQNFGWITHVAVVDDNGRILHDQYMIVERPTVITVPWYCNGNGDLKIGLIQIFRPIPRISSWETPRGFATENEIDVETAQRELLEETGLMTLSLERIGLINPNTSFYLTSIPVFAVEVDPRKLKESYPCPGEKISSCRFFSWKEIEKMICREEIVCGLTISSLLIFQSCSLSLLKK